MTDKEIIDKAVSIAIKNGFDPFTYENMFDYNSEYIPEMLLYNKDFAKALFGDYQIEHDIAVLEDEDDMTASIAGFASTKPYMLTAWQYHLQNMVISDNPIKYLGDNI